MLDLIGGFRSILAAIAGAALMYAAMSVIDITDDRAVAKAAREGMVSIFEAESAKALNAALLIAAKAQTAAAQDADRERLMLSRWYEAETQRMERSLESLLDQVNKSGRSWTLEQSDIDGMRDATRRRKTGR